MPTLGDNFLRVEQESESAEDTWHSLNQQHDGETVFKNMNVLRNLLNIIYTRSRSMGDHISILKLQYARFEAMQTSLDDSTKVEALMMTLPYIPDFELLITSISVMGEKSTSWSQLPTLFVEQGKRLNSKHETNISQTMDESGRFAQASHKMYSNNNEKKNNLPRYNIC